MAVESAGTQDVDTKKVSFAQLFEKEEDLSKFKPENIVKGVVADITKDYVHVDIGYKTYGLIPIAQFKDKDGSLNVKIGDEVDVYIVHLENDYGELILSREKAIQKKIWEEVEKKFSTGETVTGEIVCKVKGGLQVDIGIPAFLPGSQVDIRPHKNLEKFIGENYEFKILKITKEKGNIVISRRAVLLEERESLKSETLEALAEGVVMEGIVKNITDYGAFIDLGGMDGLLHITDISWGRVNHPSDKLTIGQRVPVVVIKYDKENNRVSLGMKQLKEDPWLTIEDKYPVGSKVEAKVIGLTDYGVFVEIEEGIEGLIHVSELSWSKKVKHPSKLFKEGDTVDAIVLDLDLETRKVSLGIKQLTPNPWKEIEEKYPIDSIIEGQVRSITDFGLFVEVADGVDGLVHLSDISWTKRYKDSKDIMKDFKKGQKIQAKVIGIDVEQEKLSLGIKQLEENPWERIAQRYPAGTQITGKVSALADFGVFVSIEDELEGLVHSSYLGLQKGDKITDKFKVGDEIGVEVLQVDREEHRISLKLIGSESTSESEKEDLSYMDEDSSASVTFGDLLRAKMDDDSSE